MRYSVYKFIKGVSSSIPEAIKHVLAHPESIALLNDCTDGILAIKTSLDAEKDFIEDKEIFDNIDAFCVSMEKIIDKANNNEGCSVEINSLYDIVIKINDFIDNKLKYKFRVLFLAELGAKWDAMDSVYRAMKEREDCEVEVVISPVFRAVKYPNGEVKSDIIYEDFLTPMGIPHIPFKDYDIKKDLPDITFTTQPYESVTTEQFWAQNIAPYTHLVYLPYFTSAGAITEEDIYTQCQMPIFELAWKVICQSDKAKDFYSKYAKNKGKNIIATGLPKWDYVVNMKRRDIKLPEGWEKLKGKKVMLMNVHYLNAKNVFYLRRILNTYKGERGLIFRFHPLTDTMFKIYHPNQMQEWQDFIKDVDASEHAVIDRNVNYDYAFEFSDFMNSSQSSMVFQYILTGKPVIVNDSVRMEAEKQGKDNIFIKYSSLGLVSDDIEKAAVIEDLYNGIDNNKDNRMKEIDANMSNYNSKIGVTLSELLINELLKEE